MKEIKVWPHLTIVAVICAALAAGAVALWIKHERTASAEALPNAARIERVEGDVALNNSLSAADTDWVAVVPNTPVSVGDRIYTRDNSRTSLAFTGRNFATLDPNTSLDLLALDDRRTQLALRDGNAIFDVGYLAPGDVFEVGTPYGAVNFEQPGLYQIGFDDNGGAIVSVLSGLAQVVGLGGSGRISKGEMLTLLGQTAAEVVLSRLQPNDAGYFVDNYYRQRYPNRYDGRYINYDAYLSDPYYYDPYRQYTAYQYASNYIPGLYDLDYYGDWVNLNDYGYSWRPRVDNYWAPYQSGYWMNDYPYGPTWVSNEPWGYAPYHYGRWINVNNQWYWIPDSLNTTPIYSPALVAFVPTESNYIGWVPLGPGDPYAPRYYDTNWQSHYLYGPPVIEQQIVNLYSPNAVTIVPVNEFGNEVDYRRLRRFDKAMWANARPVFDPLTVGPLRNAFLNSAWGRGKKELPPGIAKRFTDRTVITSDIPISPIVNKDLTKVLRVREVPDNVRNKKVKVRDERQQFRTIQRQVRINEAERRAARDSEQAAQRLQREQRQQMQRQNAEAERAQRQQAREQERTVRENARRQQFENAQRANEVRREANRQAAQQRSQQVRQQQQQRQNERRVEPPKRVLMPMRQPARPQATQKVDRREPRLGPPQRQDAQQQRQRIQPQRQPASQQQASPKMERGQGQGSQQKATNPGKGRGKKP